MKVKKTFQDFYATAQRWIGQTGNDDLSLFT